MNEQQDEKNEHISGENEQIKVNRKTIKVAPVESQYGRWIPAANMTIEQTIRMRKLLGLYI